MHISNRVDSMNVALRRVANRRQNSNKKHDPEYVTPPHNSYCAESIPPPAQPPLSHWATRQSSAWPPPVPRFRQPSGRIRRDLAKRGSIRILQSPFTVGDFGFCCDAQQMRIRGATLFGYFMHSSMVRHDNDACCMPFHDYTEKGTFAVATSAGMDGESSESEWEGASSWAWRRSAAHGWSRTTRSRHIWHRRRHVLRSFADGTGSDGLTSLAVSEFRLLSVLRKQFG